MNFEWDPKKAEMNLKKHGVAFEIAAYVFADLQNVTLYDSGHSSHREIRWITMGRVKEDVVVVVHTFPNEPDESVIRIISARLATREEEAYYIGGGEQGNG